MTDTQTQTQTKTLPQIIQGGMGIGVSSWRLARSVAELGQFGVISGTAVDSVLVRELQQGDPNGRLRVLADYPDQDVVDHLERRYFVPGGIAADASYRLLPMHRFAPTVLSQRILSAATFSEVRLAKEGHDGLVGMNLLTKLKRYTLAGMYGAMLAGVDALLMGAGIPIEEVEQLAELAAGRPARLKLEVDAAMAPDDAKGPFFYELDPADLVPDVRPLDMPMFFPIISSHVLARILDKKIPAGSITGWIIEGAQAGGHNAPPRGKQYDEHLRPIYDERDEPDLEQVAALGYPYYLAGGCGSPEALQEALSRGAAGIQVGTLFSLADESGYPADRKAQLIASVHRGSVGIRTDGRISSTGFPFKVVEIEDTNAMPDVYEQRTRICDLGYLQTAYVDEKGRLQGRCPAEPVDTYVAKGGDEADTEGRACLCNGLMANIGLEQRQKWGRERRLYTAGDDLESLPLGSVDAPSYTAEEVIRYLSAC